VPDADPYAFTDEPCRYNEAAAQTEQLRLMREGTALACAQAARRWLENTVYREVPDQLDDLFRAVLEASSSSTSPPAEDPAP